MMEEMDEWRNIQQVVRKSFTAMQQVIQEQGDKIRALERRQKDSASWSQVESSLAARATIQDVNQSLAGLAGVLQDKVTAADVTAACEERASRVEVQEANAALTRRLQMAENECRELRSELQDLKELLGHKANKSHLSENYPTREEIKSTYCTMNDYNRLSDRSATRTEVDNALAVLATRDEVQAALQTRAGVAEVERALASKTDVDRVMTALGERPSRVEINDILTSRLSEFRAQMASTTAKNAMFGENSSIPPPPPPPQQQSFLGTTSGVRDIIALLDQKANVKDVELLLASKVDRNELNDTLSTRVTKVEMENRIHSNAETIANEVQQALLQNQKEVVAVLNKKAYKADVHRSLKTKADAQVTADALARKPDAIEIKEALTQKLDKAACQRALTQKADITALRRVEDQMRQLAMSVSKSQGISSDELHKFRREILSVVDGKADGKHVAALVDQKVNVVDMNDALSKLSSAIQTNSFNGKSVVKEERLEALNNDLMALHSRINAESLCARWIWKSGTLAGPPSVGVAHPGELVPWNIECANANPAVFRWSTDASTIGADLPGLYEIRVGMFTDKQPRVCILVNGHAVFSTPSLDHFGSGGTVK
jgi:hypothetical protein